MKKSINYIVIIGLTAMIGCKAIQPVKMPGSLQVPGTFGEKQDSSSIAELPWKTFFKDEKLKKLIEVALQNNQDLQIAAQRIEMARANFRLNRGALLPAINAAASGGVRKFGDYTMDGIGNWDTNLSEHIGNDRRLPSPYPEVFVGLQSSWEVDLWGRLKNQKRAAYTRFMASERGQKLVVTTLVADVSSSYYELLALKYELDVLNKNIELQNAALNTIQAQKAAGMANELGVKQIRAQLLNTEALLVQKQQEYIILENYLNLLLGRFPQEIETGAPLDKQNVPKEIRTGVPASMLARRPDVQQAELELVAGKADIKAARAAFMPSLNINAYSGFQSMTAATLLSPASLAWGLLPGLLGPIFNREVLNSQYYQSVAGANSAHFNYQKVILNGYHEVVNSLRGLENYEKVYNLKQQEVQELKDAVSISNDLFATGYANYLEVITAQGNVLHAELDLIHFKKEQFKSLIELYRALGGGWK
jgi:outer membrane protein, multidrug efflux system